MIWAGGGARGPADRRGRLPRTALLPIGHQLTNDDSRPFRVIGQAPSPVSSRRASMREICGAPGVFLSRRQDGTVSRSSLEEVGKS